MTRNPILDIFRPPVFEEDVEKTHTARALNSFVWATIGIVLVISPVTILINDTWMDMIIAMGALGILLLSLVTFLFLLHFGYVRLAATLMAGSFWLITTGTAFTLGGLRAKSVGGYFLCILVAGFTLGSAAAVRFGLLSIVAATGIFVAEYYFDAIVSLPRPHVDFDNLFMFGGLLAAMTTLSALASRSFANVTGRFREELDASQQESQELEQEKNALQAQVDSLQRRAKYLEATTAIARNASSVLDLQSLLSQAVNLISERMGYYHTGLFLLDDEEEWAVLRAASSEGGKRMLERRHRLRVGVQGLVGDVAARGASRVALDVGHDAVYFDNPDLPETRSELALPMEARGRIVGVLDVQSREAEAFDDEDAALLQTLADQLAVAIDNALLFEEAEERLGLEQQGYGDVAREAWVRALRARQQLGYRYEQGDIRALGDTGKREVAEVDGLPSLSLPIRVRGETIGSIDAHKPEDSGPWTPEERTLMETLVAQLEVALESARLFQDAQQMATRERLVGELSSRFRETLDMETMLKTAVQEVRQALDLPELQVRLAVPSNGEDVENE